MQDIYLSDMAVHPSFQRLGIGQKLFSAAVEHCRSLGCSHIHLHVDETNTGAVSLYRARGFSVAEADDAHKDFEKSLMFSPDEKFLHMSMQV
jgi:ribosomal protein S18 acetylase RimI-like enzyme